MIIIGVCIGFWLDFLRDSLVDCGVRKSPWILVVCVIVGGIFGGLLGEILLAVFPPGIIQNVFTQAVHPGLTPPVTIDLWLLKVTVGFTLKMNLLTFIGILLGVFVYKQI